MFTGLGLLTSVLILIALVREGGLASRRGRLRLAAIVALVMIGLVSALALDPLQDTILVAARTRDRFAAVAARDLAALAAARASVWAA